MATLPTHATLRRRWLVPALVAALLAACDAQVAATAGPGGFDGVVAAPAAPRPVAKAGPAWWRPAKGLTWQWQLDGTIDTSVVAQVFDVDAFEVPAATVAALQRQGRKVICYFSAGSWESYRPDAGAYPASVLGRRVDGWPDERWVDIRQVSVVAPILAARLDMCDRKGFDGVEPDFMDNHTQNTGFPITDADQMRFNQMLADMAHARGLAIGLKNDLDQVSRLAGTFDYAVNEQCAQYDECDMLVPFLSRNKPVFHAEYSLSLASFCPESRRLGLSSIRKRLTLDAWRQAC